MGFFDLNIPYLESSKLAKQNTRHKETRTILTGKAMELGYTGIAYNRTITGVMSDNDFCTISLLNLSSLLKISPFFAQSVKLHREALGVCLSSVFRQYTRVTVVVDNVAQANLVNSSNAVLKSYDLVAVRPTNQAALEHACLVSEVDIIAIDFSENKPFRLRQAMVKAAIQRGVYFEIAYSDLLADARTRRRVIDNAKLLVNWTGGKNLIFSSSAPSANELRGPYDVANLMSLIGVSMECAKAANSKNCRDLLAKALRRKHFYKETIRVEAIAPDKPADSKEPWYGNWLDYDPISSGEGDLLLEDMAKSFSVSGKVTKTVKAIDFGSIMDSIPSHGLQLKDFLSETNGVSKKPRSDHTPSDLLIKTPTHNLFSPKDTHENFNRAQEIKVDTTVVEDEPKTLNDLDVHFTPVEKDTHDRQPDSVQKPNETHLRNEMGVDFDASVPFTNPTSLQDEKKESSRNSDVLNPKNMELDGVLSEFVLNNQANSHFRLSNVSLHDHIVGEQVKDMINDILLAEENLPVDSYDRVECKTSCSIANHVQIEDMMMKDQGDQPEHCYPTLNDSTTGELLKNVRDDEIVVEDHKRLLISGCQDVEHNNGCIIINEELMNEETIFKKEEVQVEDHTELSHQTLDESNRVNAGRGNGKLRTPIRAIRFPFKRMLNSVPLKKKVRKSKIKIKLG